VQRWYANVIKPYWGFCPLVPRQARGEFVNFIVNLVTAESILEMSPKLSPWDGSSHSFGCFGWYEIILISFSFLTPEREKCQLEPNLVNRERNKFNLFFFKSINGLSLVRLCFSSSFNYHNARQTFIKGDVLMRIKSITLQKKIWCQNIVTHCDWTCWIASTNLL
jgi:hypothetical protein